ncbi:homeodomain-like protein [Tanacetum coccineum]
MTRSSTKKLFTPYEEPERVLHSTRKLFKTMSLDYSSSPEFDLFSDLEDQSEEEVTGATTEPTMEEYMTMTREDYGSGLRDNTFSGSDNDDATEHVEKVIEIVDLFYIPEVTQDQIMLRVFPMSLTGTASRWLRNEPASLIDTWETLKKEFLSKYCPPARTAKKMEEINNFQQEPDETLYQAWERFKELLLRCPQYYLTDMQEVILFYKVPFPNRLIDDNYYEEGVLEGLMLPQINSKESATNLKRLLKEKLRMGYQTKASMNVHDSTIFKDSLPPKEKDPGGFTIPFYINNICFEKALADLRASVSVMPYSNFTNLGLGELAPTKLIVALADRTIKRLNGIVENVLVGIDKFVFPVDFIILDMPEDIKVPLILRRPFLSTAHAKIDVFKNKIALRVGDDKIMFKSDNPTNNIIKRVYTLGLRERMELDLEVRLMGEALILNRSLDHVYGDYIELNDLNEPLELRRNQVEDLGPTIEEGEVIDESMEDIVKTRNDDNEISNEIDEYPSFCDFDRKIHIDCAYNLWFSCMIGFEHVNVSFSPILSINGMSKRFYNSIMKDKIEYKGKNIVGAFMNVPIFVGNFSIVTDYAIVENMNVYRDHDMGEVIVGKSFSREICIKARQFHGMITIYNGNYNVTYQMARSHPRFKHPTNAQCNKMRPLLKVSARDELNEISHPYQKLKSFYKRVLNLGPEYIRDAKIEELLTCGHVADTAYPNSMDMAY